MRTVVVGGVAAGMSAAARLRRLDEDAEIIIFEKGPHVSYANCGLPYYVGGEITDESALLVQTPAKLKDALDLDVRVNHEVVSLDPQAKTVTVRHDGQEETVEYDALILSPGADALRPPLPGFDSDLVWHLRSVPDALELRRRVENGVEKAVVLGAGFIGVEAAEALANQGVQVTLVELAPHVLPPLEPELASLVTTELEHLGITVVSAVAAEAIDTDGDHAEVILSNGERIPTDLVVLSIGVRPATGWLAETGLAMEKGALIVDDHGRTSVESIWAGGDAVACTDPVTGVIRPVPLAGPANRAGRLIGDDIAFTFGTGSKPRSIPSPLGTAIVRVGDLTAALTGANRRALEEAEINYHTINLHPNQHAGYFPGASQIHLIVHFDAEDGRILGAQAVGKEGVDKRIDVLATAMRTGMAAEDLVDLDLSYSPPYGSAKDAVNMAGMMAQNVRDGVTRLWYAKEVDDILASSLVVDVRTPAEYARGHLPGALNVPHTEVRERIEEIREAAQGKPIRVHCQSGMRSYLAERVLAQEGFDVKNLSGGMLTLRESMASGLAPTVELVS